MDAEQLIQEACRSCLEQVRSKGKRDVGTGVSPLGSAKTYGLIISVYGRKPSELRQGLELCRQREGR